uniref:MRP protein-like protein n=1 Tax=Paulinella chromatophora TaxID=39717 RepID=B1X525_PAUCH|nr:MRP protein-like protein [Paulinella chromatophora]ACB43044.1 MRP protein-like protein [Paulinella chromatophora]|eukprot:gb/GEZN01001814.1/.p1 GENE.gb/GEZN01001814.1/~~gb/GEZN01001814.1/.p1  ORF type:complete len:361 (-),score=-1.62 gb/GEZN01001814.1/:493-1575(-)
MVFTTNEALQVLAVILDEGSRRSVIELGWISRLRIQNSRIIFRLELPNFANKQRDEIVKKARASLLLLEGMKDVQIEIGSTVPATAPIGQAGHGAENGRQSISGVKHILAVSSGKGGVGKSTVAVNLACALARSGLKVGLLDADIYGPNVPTMLGVEDVKPEIAGTGNQQVLSPIVCYGISMVSMGLLIDKNQPVIWRGPMLNGIIRQFLYQVEWENKDVLVVDLPPGTGDVQLSITQAIPLVGAVIVTTPQAVSLQDARRGLAMFIQMGVNILGVIENMSVFIPPDRPEQRYALFGNGGGSTLAEEADVELLTQLPMEILVQQGSDRGKPIVLSQSTSTTGKAFIALAEKIKLKFLKVE